MRRFGPTALGLGAFVATLPLLLRGGSNDGDIPVFRSYGEGVLAGQVPYRDFQPEYPPGAFLFFIVPALFPQEDYLLVFKLLAVAGFLAGILLLGLLVDRLELSEPVRYGALLFAGLAPALVGAFTLRRFDMWPAALCIGVVLLLVDRKPVWALSVLAVACLVKTYPIILLPLALLATPRAWRARALSAFCAIGLVVLVPFAAVGHGGLFNSVATQANRSLHVDTIGSSLLLLLDRPLRLAFDGGGWSVFGGGAVTVARLQTLAQVAGIAAVAFLYGRSRRRPADLVAAAVTTLAIGACLGKVLTPQYLLWFAPLLVLTRSMTATVLFALAMLATNLLFPDRYDALLDRHDHEVWLLAVRNALLVAGIAALFVAQGRRAPRARAAPT